MKQLAAGAAAVVRAPAPGRAVSELRCPLWPAQRPPVTPAAAGPPPESAGFDVHGRRAERLGHRPERFAATAVVATTRQPPAAAGESWARTAFQAPIQRVTTRSQKKADDEAKAKKRTAPVRLAAWKRRSDARKAKQRFLTGRYDTDAGPISISGLNNQRMTQARKGDYGDETFGSLPPYAKLKSSLPPHGVRGLYTRLKKKDVAKWTHKQRLATALTMGLQHGSENDRAPGLAKLIRAVARRHDADPTTPHPLDVDVNPAVSTADEARDLMNGVTPLNPDQTAAIDDYASDSSDSEDEDMGIRTKLLRHQ